MRNTLMTILALVLAVSAAASDLFPADPAKPPYSGPRNVPVARQGGDTVLDAVEVTLPVFNLAGTTAGYNDDYDEGCPYFGGGAPDVVYTFVSDVDLSLKVDLCGSSFDTKVYVYDEEFNVVGCNDDFYGGPPCGLYVSLIYGLPISAGTRYYVVIDGYGGAFGDYLLSIDELDPCDLDCPLGAEIEGEPPLTNDYVDSWNGGCEFSSDNPPFQPIATDQFCGASGMYLRDGEPAVDTDWFELVIPEGGLLEVTLVAEQPIQMWQIITEDCEQLLFWQVVRLMACEEGTMTISGNPGESILLWVCPRFNYSPDGADVFEFDYTITTNLATVRAEVRSLSEIKGLFR